MQKQAFHSELGSVEAVSTKDVLGFPKRETVAFLDSLMFLNTAAVETARSLELDTLATSCHCWYWRFLFTLLSGFSCRPSQRLQKLALPIMLALGTSDCRFPSSISRFFGIVSNALQGQTEDFMTGD